MTDTITLPRSVVEQALKVLEYAANDVLTGRNAAAALRAALEQPVEQEPASIRSVAEKHGVSMPDTYIPTIDDAIAAGDSVLMNEQAALLRECRVALDSLITQKPTLAGLLCGSTTLGNLKAELHDYRPQGVFSTHSQHKRQPLTDEAVLGVAKSIEIQFDSERLNEQIDDILVFARAIERAHGIGE